MSDLAPRAASTPSPWAAPSPIAAILIDMMGFGIVVPLSLLDAKSMRGALIVEPGAAP